MRGCAQVGVKTVLTMLEKSLVHHSENDVTLSTETRRLTSIQSECERLEVISPPHWFSLMDTPPSAPFNRINPDENIRWDMFSGHQSFRKLHSEGDEMSVCSQIVSCRCASTMIEEVSKYSQAIAARYLLGMRSFLIEVSHYTLRLNIQSIVVLVIRDNIIRVFEHRWFY